MNVALCWILNDCVAMFELLYGCLLLLLCETLAPSEPQVPRAARQLADTVSDEIISNKDHFSSFFFNSTHQCFFFVYLVCVCHHDLCLKTKVKVLVAGGPTMRKFTIKT